MIKVWAHMAPLGSGLPQGAKFSVIGLAMDETAAEPPNLGW